MDRSDWSTALTDRVTDLARAVMREAEAAIAELRLRSEFSDLVETDRVLRAKRGCRR